MEASEDWEAACLRLRRQLWRERLLFSALLLIAALTLHQSLLAHRVVAIAVEGKEAVYVADRRAAEAVLRQLAREMGVDAGARFVQRITFYPALRRGQPLSLPEEAVKRLAEQVEVVVPAYALRRPEGTPLLWALQRGEVLAALEQVKAAVSGQVGVLVEEPRVNATLDATPSYVPPEGVLTSTEDILRLLLGQRKETTEHRIQPGETAWTLAQRYGISLEELQRMNPGLDLRRLHPGQRLKVEVERVEPVVQVESLEERMEEEVIPPPVEEVPLARLKPGEKRLLRPGRPGRQRVRVHWRCVNGRPVERKVVEAQIVAHPEPAQVGVGRASP